MPVDKVISQPGAIAGGKYDISSGGKVVATGFDAVVIACPIHRESPLRLVTGADDDIEDLTKYARDYQTTHTTFVRGKVNRDLFLPREGGKGEGGAVGGGIIPASTDVSPRASGSTEQFLAYVLGKRYHDPDAMPDSVFVVEDFAASETSRQVPISSLKRYVDISVRLLRGGIGPDVYFAMNKFFK